MKANIMPDAEQSKKNTFRIIVEGNGQSFTLEAVPAEVVDILRYAVGIITTTPHSENQGTNAPPQKAAVPENSLREYLDKIKPPSFPAKILAIAAFLEDRQPGSKITKDAISRGLQEAREPLPKNFSRDFRETIRKKWLESSNSKQTEFYTTTFGRAALQDNFSNERRPRKREDSK